jgi:hypothetical protein
MRTTAAAPRFTRLQNLTADEFSNSEPSIAVDPNNPSHVVALTFARTRENTLVAGRAYFSKDGGQTWRMREVPLLPDLPENVGSGGDPWVTFDGRGRAYLGYMFASEGSPEVVVHTDDMGETLSAPAPAIPRRTEFGELVTMDKMSVSADQTPSSPYFNRLYAPLVAHGGITVGRSDDGVHFENAAISIYVPHPLEPGEVRPETFAMNAAFAPVAAASPDGEVYVAWMGNRSDNGDDAIILSRSTDGGATFPHDRNVVVATDTERGSTPAMNVRGLRLTPSIDVDRSNGPHRGRIYVAWSQLVNRAPTIVLAHSDDRGKTWSEPREVSPAPGADSSDPNTQVDQIHPAVAVDPTDGTVVLTFRDTRYDSGADRRRATDVFLTYSRDGGDTFAPALRVTPESTSLYCHDRSNCLAEGVDRVQFGEYEGLSVSRGTAHLALVGRDPDSWDQEIYTTSVDIRGLP